MGSSGMFLAKVALCVVVFSSQTLGQEKKYKIYIWATSVAVMAAPVVGEVYGGSAGTGWRCASLVLAPHMEAPLLSHSGSRLRGIASATILATAQQLQDITSATLHLTPP